MLILHLTLPHLDFRSVSILRLRITPLPSYNFLLFLHIYIHFKDLIYLIIYVRAAPKVITSDNTSELIINTSELRRCLISFKRHKYQGIKS